tara:strand:+ start:527 stop:1138 length:612 start_codon:yes stop_codon:yes gene_type:complete
MFCKYPAGDLNARLSGTICRYDGIPYLIQITDGGSIRLCDLVTGEEESKIVSSDPKFDISTPELGYVNFRGYCMYLSRYPGRRYKQGIDNRNTLMTALPNNPNGARAGRGGHNLHCEEVRKMLLNNYGDGRAVLEKLRAGKYTSRAISRSVAFSIDAIGLVSVFYKNSLVGHIYPDKDFISVPTSDMAWIVSCHIDGFGFEVD